MNRDFSNERGTGLAMIRQVWWLLAIPASAMAEE
jgi:hypothetical protein